LKIRVVLTSRDIGGVYVAGSYASLDLLEEDELTQRVDAALVVGCVGWEKGSDQLEYTPVRIAFLVFLETDDL